MQQQITLMDKHRIERTIKRLAIQVWERISDGDEIVIFGLNERGFATAEQLVSHLKEQTETEIGLHQFNVHGTGPKATLPNCTEKYVLIVDDVIFSGKTVFSALSTICHSSEPNRIEVLSLVDRGHRRYPVLSGLTGINVPTKFGEHIEVMLDEGKLDRVILFKNT
jgi:pyrimidine operon attenuation protein/uracil phosphoribosyltransferase